MKYSLPRALLLSSVLLTGSAFADTDLSYIFMSQPKNTFSAALTIRGAGNKVHFGRLGTVVPPILNTFTGVNQYNDGFVSADGPRVNGVGGINGFETQPSNKLSADGTRYYTFATDPTTGVVFQTGDFLAYKDGQTRSWQYQNAGQIVDGYVNLHAGYAVTEGASAEAKQTGSAGFDLELNHDFGRIGKNGGWGMVIGFGTAEINGKTTATVTSSLSILTARYSLMGQPAPTLADGTPSYTAPTFDSFNNEAGDLIDPTGHETTTPLSTKIVDGGTVTIPDGATVSGYYQMKAAYYIIRLGPSFRFQVANRFTASFSGGAAAAVIGSTFTSDETLVTPTISAAISTDPVRARKFKAGGFAEANAEYWLTYRTGFFVGAVYEHFGKYTQSNHSGETASINIGSGLSFRLGIITRF
jgi:hypothetical protein